MKLQSFLVKKGQEYARFDPCRMEKIYASFSRFYTLDAKIFHLIGSNGKGSTGRFIALSLMQNGYRVIHFSSPHLFAFNERFFLNYKALKVRKNIDSNHHLGALCNDAHNITDAELESAHNELMSIDGVSEASYFEYASLLLVLLARAADFIVLEAGLGGEFDSTNILVKNVNPSHVCSIFTSISFDHMEFLGNTIEDIASTKLRAMSQNALLAPQDFHQTHQIAVEIARKRGANIHCIRPITTARDFAFELESFDRVFAKSAQNLAPLHTTNKSTKDLDSIFASFQAYIKAHNYPYFLQENLLNAFFALRFFGEMLDFVTLPALNLPARMQCIGNVMLDVGHNIACAKMLVATLREKFGISEDSVEKPILFYNSYADKRIKDIIQILAPIIARIIVYPVANNERIIGKNELMDIIRSCGLESREFGKEDKEVIELAFKNAFLDDSIRIVVFGSFSVVGAFMEEFGLKK